MTAKQFVSGTVVGGMVLYATGFVIFGMILSGLYAANTGTATGVARTADLVWAVVLGNLSYAALITLVLANRSTAVSVGKGAMFGAVVGFLLWFTADFILYGITNISTLTRTIVDPMAELVHGGLGGATIAAVSGWLAGPKSPGT